MGAINHERSADDEAARIVAEQDQQDAALDEIARAVARYYGLLREGGVEEPALTALIVDAQQSMQE